MCVGRGEVRARDETSTEREEIQRARHNERFHRRMPRYERIIRRRNGGGAPIDGIGWKNGAAIWK